MPRNWRGNKCDCAICQDTGVLVENAYACHPKCNGSHSRCPIVVGIRKTNTPCPACALGAKKEGVSV